MKICIAGPTTGIPEQSTTKECVACNQHKQHSEFNKNRRKCKLCAWEYTKKWRAENRDKYLATQKRSDEKRKGRRHNPEHVRRWKLKALYGMTVRDYETMFHAQGGKCAVCGAIGYLEPGDRAKPRLAIDHDHSTGRVRGLLCSLCNQAEGLIKTVTAAESLLKYMKKHSS